jgi:hypothetical protein
MIDVSMPDSWENGTQRDRPVFAHLTAVSGPSFRRNERLPPTMAPTHRPCAANPKTACV